MYHTKRFFFPHGKEDEAMDCTFKEFSTIEKAIAYAHRYSGGVRFAACKIEDEDGNLLYEILGSGTVTDYK